MALKRERRGGPCPWPLADDRKMLSTKLRWKIDFSWIFKCLTSVSPRIVNLWFKSEVFLRLIFFIHFPNCSFVSTTFLSLTLQFFICFFSWLSAPATSQHTLKAVIIHFHIKMSHFSLSSSPFTIICALYEWNFVVLSCWWAYEN